MGIAGAACLWEASSGHLCLPPQMPGSVPISKGSQPGRPPLATLLLRAHGFYRIPSWKDPGLMSHSFLSLRLDEVDPRECLGLEDVGEANGLCTSELWCLWPREGLVDSGEKSRATLKPPFQLCSCTHCPS